MIMLKMTIDSRLIHTIYKCDSASNLLLIAQLLLFIIKTCKQPHSNS